MSEPARGKGVVGIPASLSVRQLAELMSISPIVVIKALMNAGVMANINQQIDYETAAIVAQELGFEPREDMPAVAEETPEEGPTGSAPCLCGLRSVPGKRTPAG